MSAVFYAKHMAAEQVGRHSVVCWLNFIWYQF